MTRFFSEDEKNQKIPTFSALNYYTSGNNKERSQSISDDSRIKAGKSKITLCKFNSEVNNISESSINQETKLLTSHTPLKQFSQEENNVKNAYIGLKQMNSQSMLYNNPNINNYIQQPQYFHNNAMNYMNTGIENIYNYSNSPQYSNNSPMNNNINTSNIQMNYFLGYNPNNYNNSITNNN